ncbi:MULTISPECIES: PilZ domain-containing protein [unclassified Rhizobium]|uniref:PilZ domain-containing protein n=1 Tax=unclassified Rhizobium TaxID=2613769 RepID=UPI002B240462|nr:MULTISPECIES: PilZ domain-containing protein [unclassified Rhizobium]
MNMSIVSFEADEQRQHARYKLPLKCVIDQHRYSSIDWSLGGVGVATGDVTFEEGQVLPLQLQIPLDGFDMLLPVKAEVRHSSAETGRTGFKFVDTSPSRSVCCVTFTIHISVARSSRVTTFSISPGALPAR